MNRYILYCTREQIKKALELGAPIEQHEGVTTAGAPEGYYLEVNTLVKIPTAEQMRGWLMDKLKATTFSNKHYSCGVKDGYGYLIIGSTCILEIDASDNGKYLLNTDKDASLAAIDAALEYLLKK